MKHDDGTTVVVLQHICLEVTDDNRTTVLNCLEDTLPTSTSSLRETGYFTGALYCCTALSAGCW